MEKTKTKWNGAHPVEVRKLIYKMIKGEIKSVLTEFHGKTIVSPTLAAALIKAEFNYDMKPKAISNAKERYYKQENIEGQNKKGKCPHWCPNETARCKELVLLIDDRSSTEVWQKMVLDPLDEEFPVRIHTAGGVRSKMLREGFKRTNTWAISDKKSKEYWIARWLEGGWEYISHEEGTTVFQVRHLKCGKESRKSKVKNQGCRYCAEDANLLGTLYLAKIFFPTGSGDHSKPGKAGDTFDKVMRRMKSFGYTRLDQTWNDLPNWFIYEVEDKVDEKYGLFKTSPPELQDNGRTECYNTLVHNQIRDYMDQLVQEFTDAKSSIPQNIS